MITSLENKKILLFCSKFFNYENEIKKELESQGAIVDYFDERFGNSSINKIIIRLHIIYLAKVFSKKYYNNIIENQLKEKYDYIFFINAETILPEILKKFKKKYSNSEFILYMWDSIKNKPKTKGLLKYFDKIYSFDKEDTFINKKIKFLPLFYIKSYTPKKTEEFLYDISFIGTIHCDRFKILHELKKECLSKNLKYYFYLFFQNKNIILLKKIIDKNLKELSSKDIVTKKLTHKEIENIYSKSKTIIDIQNFNQSGLTMRTFEIALGLRKKLITTNQNIKEYDFYNENNILIIDRKSPFIQKEFFDKEYEILDEKIYKKYSLKKWIENIFE